MREAVQEPAYTVFHMRATGQVGEGENQADRVVAGHDVESAVVSLVADLASYSPRSKVVLLEGENSGVDARIVSQGSGPDKAVRAPSKVLRCFSKTALRHARVNEAKLRQVLRCFCADLTAAQTTELCGLNRKTVLRLYTLFRRRSSHRAGGRSDLRQDRRERRDDFGVLECNEVQHLLESLFIGDRAAIEAKALLQGCGKDGADFGLRVRYGIFEIAKLGKAVLDEIAKCLVDGRTNRA